MLDIVKRGVFFCLACVAALTLAPFVSAEEVVIPVTEEGGSRELVTGDTGRFEIAEAYEDNGETVTVDSVEFRSDSPEIIDINEDGTFSAVSHGVAEVGVTVYVKRNITEDDSLFDDIFSGIESYSDDFYTDGFGGSLYDDGSGDGYYDGDYDGSYGDDYYDDGYDDGYGDDDYDDSYGDDSYQLFTAYFNFIVKPDLTNVALKGETAKTAYITDYMEPSFTFDLESSVSLSESYDESIVVSFTSSNSEVSVEGSLRENVISLWTSGEGKTKVTITINEKQFYVTLKIVRVSMAKNSLLMKEKQSKPLKVKGVKKGVKWSSSNPKVVKVSSNGKLKARKKGNAVIKASIGEISFGCAVSVVSPGKYKVVKGAIRMAKNGTYSQAKRMSQGYYDCSSLTWRNYKKIGITLGNRNYAPVAADQGKWCVKGKKVIKGGLSNKNIKNMKLRAGDLMFESGESNGRFRNIYHVEMISGYICYGFDYKGKPVLGITWANRVPDAYARLGQLVGRP